MRYTAVFEFQEGAEPAVGKKDKWLGGELCAVQFSDVFEELERLQLCIDANKDGHRECMEENRKLRGERAVLAELLMHATAVLRTIDPEETSEWDLLQGLIARAEKACAEVTPNAALRGDSGLIAGVPLESTVMQRKD